MKNRWLDQDCSVSFFASISGTMKNGCAIGSATSFDSLDEAQKWIREALSDLLFQHGPGSGYIWRIEAGSTPKF